MQKFVLALIVGVTLAGPVAARTVAVPPNHPAIVMTLPPSWKNEKIDFGYSAMSANSDVFISVEFARPGNVEAMMKLNEKWMAENKIKLVTPSKEEGLLNNVPVTRFGFDTTDENGPTLIDFYMIKAGNDLAMVTIWGSAEERNDHKDDVDAFIASIKPAH